MKRIYSQPLFWRLGAGDRISLDLEGALDYYTSYRGVGCDGVLNGLLVQSPGEGDPTGPLHLAVEGSEDGPVIVVRDCANEVVTTAGGAGGGGDNIGTSDFSISENRTVEIEETFTLAFSGEGDLVVSGYGASSTYIGSDEGNVTIDVGNGGAGTGNFVVNAANTGRTIINSLITIPVTFLPTYADDTAAGGGGLTSGMLYKTAAGAIMVKL